MLIDSKGHLIHIDYGFLLGTSPGGNLGFETAPFKLTTEMVELMGGLDSDCFQSFIRTFVHGFLSIRSSANNIMNEIVTLISAFADSGLPCFQCKKQNLNDLYLRFLPGITDSEAAEKLILLVKDAANKWTTKAYDYVQFVQNNIH